MIQKRGDWLPNTFNVTEPLPTFPYWSSKVIVVDTVSPLCVVEPLKSTVAIAPLSLIAST